MGEGAQTGSHRVSNNRIAKNSWERKFYTSSVPSHIKVSFLELEETARQLLNNLFKNESVMILFESVKDVHSVVELGVTLNEINIGGLHYREGAHELLPYVFLTDEDKSYLRELVKKSVALLAQVDTDVMPGLRGQFHVNVGIECHRIANERTPIIGDDDVGHLRDANVIGVAVQ